MYAFAKSVIKISSTLQEPKTYHKAISDPIHSNKWHETIDDKL